MRLPGPALPARPAHAHALPDVPPALLFRGPGFCRPAVHSREREYAAPTTEGGRRVLAGPYPAAAPLVPQRNLTELVVAVTDENIVGLFAALLAERRVLLMASKLSTVRRDAGVGPERPSLRPPLWTLSGEAANSG